MDKAAMLDGHKADCGPNEINDLNDADDDTYQTHLSDLENALKASDISRLDSESMRQELNQYVEMLGNKKDSEGNSFLNVPSNFGVITNAMTRDDLVSNVEAPWSKYLLQEGLDEQIKKEYHGRYKSVLNDTETKVQQGLAQIQWLDRQLDTLSIYQQSAAIRHKRSSNNDVDGTFVTRSELNEDSIGSSLVTGRVEALNDTGSGDDLLSQKIPTPRMPQNIGKSSSGARAALTFEEEYKLTALLSDSYSCPSYKDSLMAEEKRMLFVDSQLKEYGRLARCYEEDEEFIAQRADTDYLTQQRFQREKENYLKKLDNMLEKCKSKHGVSVILDDLSRATTSKSKSIYSTAQDSGYHSGASVASSESHVTNTVPELKHVNVDRAITRADIISLVQSMPLEDKGGSERGDISKETLMKINHLLASYKREIDRLLLISNEQPPDQARQSIASAPSSTFPSAHHNDLLTTREVDPSGYEDSLQFLQMSSPGESTGTDDLKINLDHARLEKTTMTSTEATKSGRRRGKRLEKVVHENDYVVQEYSSCDFNKLPPIPTSSVTSSDFPKFSSPTPPARPMSNEAVGGKVVFPQLPLKYDKLTAALPFTVFTKTVGSLSAKDSFVKDRPCPPKSMRIHCNNKHVDDRSSARFNQVASNLNSEKANSAGRKKEKISI